jgi:hypothetical protein
MNDHVRALSVASHAVRLTGPQPSGDCASATRRRDTADEPLPSAADRDRMKALVGS